MLKLWKNKPSPSHEKLFLTYYSRLLGWAMQLTGQDRQGGGPCSTTCFVQFVVVEPSWAKSRISRATSLPRCGICSARKCAGSR
jgi:hypothetical protein